VSFFHYAAKPSSGQAAIRFRVPTRSVQSGRACSSLVLGFIGAGGIGFELLSAMSLFRYRLVSLYPIVTFVLVIAAERLSALIRARLA
jgi:hypothetical protein